MINFDMQVIGRQLEKARKKAGFTQEVIAQYLGIDQGIDF